VDWETQIGLTLLAILFAILAALIAAALMLF
jgi:hypothetical protein